MSRDKRQRFRSALVDFRADLRGGAFRPGLRVKRVQAESDEAIWEMTWAPDGRATFHYGDELIPGQRHVVWRRIGPHDIFLDP